MRGAPFYFPTADAPIFTTGVLPPTEAGKLQLILGVGPSLKKLGLNLGEVIELMSAEIRHVLHERRLAIDDLGRELAQRMDRHLSRNQREVWRQEGPRAVGQPLGEAVVHFCLRILTLQGVICVAMGLLTVQTSPRGLAFDPVMQALGGVYLKAPSR